MSPRGTSPDKAWSTTRGWLVAVLVLAGTVAAGATRVQTADGAAGDPVLLAVGDLACDPASGSFNGGRGTASRCRARATSDLAVGSGASVVATLGDHVYKCGSAAAFTQSYAPTWGRVKSLTRPALGNHEYVTKAAAPQTGCTAANAGAAGYFGYFGGAAGTRGQGYYSYDVGTWHVVVLNSNCGSVSCAAGSAQVRWLQADLAAHRTTCTLAYFHHALFASGGQGTPSVRPLWNALYAADVDVVLNGHVHLYERFAPLTPAGTVDRVRGIREFIVGTGGVEHEGVPGTRDSRSEARNATTYGVLSLSLAKGHYDWRFLPEAGRTWTDSGSAACDP